MVDPSVHTSSGAWRTLLFYKRSTTWMNGEEERAEMSERAMPRAEDPNEPHNLEIITLPFTTVSTRHHILYLSYR